jgi:hypothetical protein
MSRSPVTTIGADAGVAMGTIVGLSERVGEATGEPSPVSPRDSRGLPVLLAVGVSAFDFVPERDFGGNVGKAVSIGVCPSALWDAIAVAAGD